MVGAIRRPFFLAFFSDSSTAYLFGPLLCAARFSPFPLLPASTPRRSVRYTFYISRGRREPPSFQKLFLASLPRLGPSPLLADEATLTVSRERSLLFLLPSALWKSPLGLGFFLGVKSSRDRRFFLLAFRPPLVDAFFDLYTSRELSTPQFLRFLFPPLSSVHPTLPRARHSGCCRF